MIRQCITEDIQCQGALKRNGRRRRQRDADDHGNRHVVVVSIKTGEKAELKPPTNAEQSELLQVATEKSLRDSGLKEAAIRQEMREWEPIFRKAYARYLHALNPYAGERWWEILHEVIEANDFDDTPWMVTIIADDWMFSTYPHGPSDSDLRRMLSRMRRSTRRELRGVPFLLQADFAVRRQTVGYRIAIEVHWHGLIWAPAQQIEALKKRLPANRFGAARFHARAVYNLGGALRYIAKDTRFGYRTVKNFGFQPESRHQKAWFQFREAIYGPQRWLLIAMTGSLTKPDLCSASGGSLKVLREAKQLARERGYRTTSLRHAA